MNPDIRKRTIWLLAMVFILLITFLPGYTKLQELKEENRDLQVKIDKIKLENALLENEISRLKQDPIYQEEIIRDKLGVVRKGEVIYKLESMEKE
jgi:cell division protein FtsB